MTHVVRYKVNRQAPGDIDPKSRTLIIAWPSDGHDGGDLAFGNDRYLYISSGDGTSGSDVNLTGQRIDDLPGFRLADRTSTIPNRVRIIAFPKTTRSSLAPGARPRALGIWPAQSLAVELRSRNRPTLGRPERARPLGAGLPDPEKEGITAGASAKGAMFFAASRQSGARSHLAADRRTPS